MTIIPFKANPTAPTIHDLPLIRSLPPDVESLIASVQTDGRLPEGTNLSTSSRQQMFEMSERLQAIMADKRPEVETKTLTFLLSVFPRQAGSGDVSDMLLMAYDMALEDVPTWAVEEAARRWISGKCGERRFAPTPPEMRLAADEVVLLARGRAAVLRTIAKAEIVIPPTPEQLARAATLANFIKVKPIDESEVS